MINMVIALSASPCSLTVFNSPRKSLSASAALKQQYTQLWSYRSELLPSWSRVSSNQHFAIVHRYYNTDVRWVSNFGSEESKPLSVHHLRPSPHLFNHAPTTSRYKLEWGGGGSYLHQKSRQMGRAEPSLFFCNFRPFCYQGQAGRQTLQLIDHDKEQEARSLMVRAILLDVKY